MHAFKASLGLSVVGMLLLGCPPSGGSSSSSSGDNNPNTSSSSGGSSGASSSSSGGSGGSGCTPGTLGCPCNAGACNGTLVCTNNTCAEPSLGPAMAVVAANARACDVLLNDPDGVVVGVVFGSAVRGQALQRGKSWGISFHALTDTALGAGLASLSLKSGGAATNVTLTSASCADRTGTAIAGTGVTVTP
jgi:hypothetical protein